MRLIDWNAASSEDRERALLRPTQARQPEVTAKVAEILADIRARGADAVGDWSLRLDGAPMRRIDISEARVAEAAGSASVEDRAALSMAAGAIRRFHEADRPVDGQEVEALPGILSRRVWRPLERVGLYVPGGTAPLFSTLLMLALPARAAGVTDRIVVTPPNRDGSVDPLMVLAAREAGLEAIWLVGGAQAIGALAFGAGLPRADKIFGPGNAWVAEAKRQVSAEPGGPAIDLPAGPSELMVVADDGADAELVAADLLGQAEHDADAQVVLATPDPVLARATQEAIARRLRSLPRAEIAGQALQSGALILCRDVAQAIDIANAYAPEHLSLQVRDPDNWIALIRNAGVVFAGARAAETFGDYLAGPSHVLPTDGAARAFSGVTTASFMKSFAVQRVRPEAMARAAAAAARLARLEGLEAHALAADLRWERLTP
ncbi:histidinol dehydrogenase [Brevundimonas sp. 2R-24]|uniref:Histidinol dehydrogenase n=1 Tax=Peiella sedimenti TaxID=3061083 RepID=A0ABT8SJ16_9CAUL|nr:histidinol dehydrogenase [Caulobacteraceae bacterium XZ-24]